MHLCFCTGGKTKHGGGPDSVHGLWFAHPCFKPLTPETSFLKLTIRFDMIKGNQLIGKENQLSAGKQHLKVQHLSHAPSTLPSLPVKPRDLLFLIT